MSLYKYLFFCSRTDLELLSIRVCAAKLEASTRMALSASIVSALPSFSAVLGVSIILFPSITLLAVRWWQLANLASSLTPG